MVHASWAASQTTDARVETGPELTLVDSGLDADTFNVVCAARLPPEDVAEEARRVIDYFASVGRPFSWWVGPGDEPPDLGRRLDALGLRVVEEELAMSAALDEGRPEAPSDDRLRVERVSTPERLADFARINAENWSPPDTVVEAFYRRAASALLGAAAPQRLFLALLRDEPAAGVEVTLAAGVAGVYDLATRSAYRGRRIATRLLAGALEDAKAAGYRRAVLQATAAAAGLYRRLGFREFGRIAEHKLGAYV